MRAYIESNHHTVRSADDDEFLWEDAHGFRKAVVVFGLVLVFIARDRREKM